MDPSVDRTELEAKTGGDILDGLHNSLKKAKKNTADGGAVTADDELTLLPTER